MKISVVTAAITLLALAGQGAVAGAVAAAGAASGGTRVGLLHGPDADRLAGHLRQQQR